MAQNQAQSTPDKAAQTHIEGTEPTEIDPDLQRIIEAWPELTADDRCAIVADVMARLEVKAASR